MPGHHHDDQDDHEGHDHDPDDEDDNHDALKKTILPARCVFLAPLAAAAAVNPTRKQSQKTSYNLKHQDHDLDDDGDDFLQRKVNCVWEFV